MLRTACAEDFNFQNCCDATATQRAVEQLPVPVLGNPPDELLGCFISVYGSKPWVYFLGWQGAFSRLRLSLGLFPSYEPGKDCWTGCLLWSFGLVGLGWLIWLVGWELVGLGWFIWLVGWEREKHLFQFFIDASFSCLLEYSFEVLSAVSGLQCVLFWKKSLILKQQNKKEMGFKCQGFSFRWFL